MEKKRGMNKKGAEMTIGTIIVIILALVVLVVIIYGFMTGWGNLWGKITGISGGKANVDINVQSCQLDCQTSAKEDYCKPRNITFADNGQPAPSSCTLLAQSGQYGLDACSNIDCTSINQNPALPGKACTAWTGGQWAKNQCTTLTTATTTFIQMPSNMILQTDITNPDNAGQICCVPLSTCPSGSWSVNSIACSSRTPPLYDITNYLTKADQTTHQGQICCIA